MSSSSWVLGIDCGTTMTKVAAFALDGSSLGSESTPTGRGPSVSIAPHDRLAGIWASVCQATRALLDRTELSSSDLLGVACTGHGNGLYALDAHRNAVIAPLPATELRAADIVAGVSPADRERLVEATWQGPWPGQTAVLLAWLERHDPAAFAAVRHVVMCKDYVNLRLTGNLTTDHTDLSTAGLLALPGRQYATDVGRVYGLPELADWLPAVSSPTEVVGEITPAASDATGLPAGLPVAAGAVDIVASAIGSGAAAPGKTAVVAGTWSINGVVTSEPLVDARLAMTTTFIDDLWYAVDSSAASAANLEWLVKSLWRSSIGGGAGSRDDPFETHIAAAATRLPADDDPIYLPYLNGSLRDPDAAGCFAGLRSGHDRADLTRSVLEGVAFGHREHLERIWDAGAEKGPVTLAGGAARSSYWTQLIADALRVPVEVSDTTAPGARGAALLAAVAAGVFDSVGQAAASCVRVSRYHEPSTEAADVVARRFDRFRAVGRALGSLT